MSVEIRIWQLVTATALVALAAGVLIGHSFTGGGAPKSDSAKAGSTDTAYERELVRMHRRELQSAAEANVRAAIPAIEAYNADHDRGYTGATLEKLQTQYDAGVRNVAIVSANASTYCIENTAPAGFSYHKAGPGGDILPGPCS